jgi:hypothetical protein
MAAPFCKCKDDLTNRLINLAEEHFKITNGLLDPTEYRATAFQKCKQVREQWLALMRELEEHGREHGC